MWHCSRRLSDYAASLSYEQRAERLAIDIAASVPYHITSNLNDFLQLLDRGGAASQAYGRPVGGLLLLHPLYVATLCSIVATDFRQYFCRCLELIGHSLGIGQATILSSTTSNAADGLDSARFPYLQPIRDLPFQQMAEGHVLIWAGMLLHSS